MKKIWSSANHLPAEKGAKNLNKRRAGFILNEAACTNLLDLRKINKVRSPHKVQITFLLKPGGVQLEGNVPCLFSLDPILFLS